MNMDQSLVSDLYDQFINLQALVDLLLADRATALDSLLTPDQKQQTEDIQEELGPRIEEAQIQLDVAVKQLKRAVTNQAVTFLAKQHTVSYVSGRVKWDTDILENLMFECPDIVTARKQSRPYVMIKARK